MLKQILCEDSLKQILCADLLKQSEAECSCKLKQTVETDFACR